MNIQLQPSFVIHSRPFRDTSVIVDVFSTDFGRLSLLAKGQRGSNNRKRFSLQPFSPLLLSWRGRGELKYITAAETNGPSYHFEGERLFCVLYANEILIRLLPPSDAYPKLYIAYERLLRNLGTAEFLEPELRIFEFALLEQMGYGFDFSTDSNSGEKVLPGKLYRFIPDFGFRAATDTDVQPERYFNGTHLLSIDQGHFDDSAVRQAAKIIMRSALAPHLGHKPLNSRKLFRR